VATLCVASNALVPVRGASKACLS